MIGGLNAQWKKNHRKGTWWWWWWQCCILEGHLEETDRLWEEHFAFVKHSVNKFLPGLVSNSSTASLGTSMVTTGK